VQTPTPEQTPKVVKPTPKVGTINKFPITIDGKKVECLTINYNNNLYAVFTDLCFYFNCDFKTDNKNRTINILKDKKGSQKGIWKGFVIPKTNTSIKLDNGSYSVKVDSTDACLEPVSYMGKTFVPLRYFAEIFDKKVEFIAAKNRVVISNQSNPVIGTVNGKPIYQRQFDFYYNLNAESLNGITDKKQLEEQKKSLKLDTFNIVVQDNVIKQQIPKEIFVLTDKDYAQINSQIQGLVSSNGGVFEARKIFAKKNIYLTQIFDYFKNTVINNKFAEKLLTDNKKLEQYYNKNKAEFVENEKVRAKHILFATKDLQTNEPYDEKKIEEIKKKAEEVLKSAKEGANFDELIKKNNEDLGMEANGYTFSKGDMVKEFEDSAFSMKVGEISDLVKTEFGYHIIKLEEKIPAKQLTFEEFKAKFEMSDELISSYLNKLLGEWKANSKIVNKMK